MCLCDQGMIKCIMKECMLPVVLAREKLLFQEFIQIVVAIMSLCERWFKKARMLANGLLFFVFALGYLV